MENRQKHRPTLAQRRQRVDELYRIVLDGAEFTDVREYIREKEQEEGSCWKLEEGEEPMSNSQIRRYVRKVDAIIARSCQGSREKLLNRHLAKRRNLYAKAVLAGDVRSASSILRDEAELLGLYPGKQKEEEKNPGGKSNGIPDGFTAEQYRDVQLQLAAQLLRSIGCNVTFPPEPARVLNVGVPGVADQLAPRDSLPSDPPPHQRPEPPPAHQHAAAFR